MTLGVLRDMIAHEWGNGNDYTLQKRIEYAIIAARATIIQRRYDSTKIFPQSLIARVKTTRLIQVNETECCKGCSGSLALRTKDKVPKPIIVKDDSYFIYVGSTSQRKAFSYVPFTDVEFIKEREFSSREIFYSYMDNYIYIINANSLKDISIRYVPENPLDLLNFGDCDCDDCPDPDDYYIEESLVEGIQGLLQQRKPQINQEKPNAEIEVNE